MAAQPVTNANAAIAANISANLLKLEEATWDTPTPDDLKLIYELLCDRRTQAQDPIFTLRNFILSNKDGNVMKTLQYLTVLHLAMTNIFDSGNRDEVPKGTYEDYKKIARELWGWKADTTSEKLIKFFGFNANVNNPKANFKRMMRNTGKIDATIMDIRPTVLAELADVEKASNFLDNLYSVIIRATANIERIKLSQTGLQLKLPRLGTPIREAYEKIHKDDNRWMQVKGGKRTSRKNKSRRKQRTYKRKH